MWTTGVTLTNRTAVGRKSNLLGKSKIVPDLIVHHVGHQADNLLVVEAELDGNYDYERDIRKLFGMTEEGEYSYALACTWRSACPDAWSRADMSTSMALLIRN